jgi:tripartite-type tricarboxylate transporter receptor subunit TctC
MRTLFRTLIAAGLAGALSALPTAQAQTNWPTKAIKLVVPFPPGGATDVVSRIVAASLAERLGQPIVVENRVGAGGVIGTDAAAKAPADGYTLLAVFDNFTTNPHLFRNVESDPVRDFAPISQLVRSYQLVVVPPGLGVKRLEDLIALARTKGSALNYATAGAGTSSHLAMELLKATAGIDPTAIHFKGGNPAMTAILGGQVDLMMVTTGTGIPHVRSGKLLALAVSSPGRGALTDVPPIAQTFPGFETQSWTGFVAPAGTPREIITRIHHDIVASLATPEVRQKLEAQGYEPVGSTPEALGELVKNESARWGKLIRERRITID